MKQLAEDPLRRLSLGEGSNPASLQACLLAPYSRTSVVAVTKSSLVPPVTNSI